MSVKKDEAGMVFHLRFGEWCRNQRLLTHMTSLEAVERIRDRFNVSRATAYRWLAAWRQVNPDNQTMTVNP